ncbi:regulatory protein RecX [Polymorphum gilvum]|nr:RecX family transcriptional regulator [Polymorphum gilvum]
MRTSTPKTWKLPTEERLARSALAYLERYASSAENLRRVLARKVTRAARAHDRDPAEFAALIDAVVARCLRAGLVDDTAFAETRVASQRRRGRSTRQIAAGLAAKGVDKSVIEAVLARDDTDDGDAARRLARRRRLGPWRTRGARADFRDRDLAALCRAGFGFDVARRVIDGDAEDDGDDGTATA